MSARAWSPSGSEQVARTSPFPARVPAAAAAMSLKVFVPIKRVVDYAVKIRLNAAKSGAWRARRGCRA